MQGDFTNEIIVIGGVSHAWYSDFGVIHILFDEAVRNGWITRKKNLISKAAKYENIVYLHDYIYLMPSWAEGIASFGNDWDLAMTRVSDIKGRRFYDWINWDHPSKTRYTPVDYDNSSDAQYNFVPGAYWIAKKALMLNQPLNEELTWGESEDIEWSLRVRNFKYVMIKDAEVRHLKKHRGYKFWKPIY